MGARYRYKILGPSVVEFANLIRAWATLSMRLIVDIVEAPLTGRL